MNGLQMTYRRLVYSNDKLFWWAVAQEDGDWYVLESYDHCDSWLVNCIMYREEDAIAFIETWCEQGGDCL